MKKAMLYFMTMKAYKKKLIETIKKVLQEKEEVIFAYLYGSFVESEVYNDIDIAIYVDEKYLEKIFNIKTDIALKLAELTGKEPESFDIQCLNFAFKSEKAGDVLVLYDVFNKGLLLVDKNPDLRTDLIEKLSFILREVPMQIYVEEIERRIL